MLTECPGRKLLTVYDRELLTLPSWELLTCDRKTTRPRPAVFFSLSLSQVTSSRGSLGILVRHRSHAEDLIFLHEKQSADALPKLLISF